MRAAILCLLLASLPARALAQQDRPLPPFAIDVRGLTTALKADALTAAELLIPTSALPTRTFGASIGAQVYLLRWRDRAVGVGVEAVRGRGIAHVVDGTGAVVADVVDRIEGVAGMLSINFGHREGWSYLSAGMGSFRRETFVGSGPLERQPGKTVANAGGGARWFITGHIAFGFDVRLYLGKPAASTPTTPGRGRQNLLLLSAGVAIK